MCAFDGRYAGLALLQSFASSPRLGVAAVTLVLQSSGAETGWPGIGASIRYFGGRNSAAFKLLLIK
jgi:hypothetical protein